MNQASRPDIRSKGNHIVGKKQLEQSHQPNAACEEPGDAKLLPRKGDVVEGENHEHRQRRPKEVTKAGNSSPMDLRMSRAQDEDETGG